MSHGNLLVALVFALFAASAMSTFAAWETYRNSARQPSARALTVVTCAVIAILFFFAALWIWLAQPHMR